MSHGTVLIFHVFRETGLAPQKIQGDWVCPDVCFLHVFLFRFGEGEFPFFFRRTCVLGRVGIRLLGSCALGSFALGSCHFGCRPYHPGEEVGQVASFHLLQIESA